MNTVAPHGIVRNFGKAAGLVAIVFSVGCGMIADKDRIIVAAIGDEPIRRGDLMEIIRDMPDEERPIIQTTEDLLATLNGIIDERLKEALARNLRKQQLIKASRDAARRMYMRIHPEYINVARITDPSVLNLTEGDLVALRAEIEFGIDEVEERLLRAEALQYKIREALQKGTLSISDEEYRAEYARRRGELVRLERVDFQALQFPTQMSKASAHAANARQRIASGETFEALFDAFKKLDPSSVIESSMENDPSVRKFEGFWSIVSGSKSGDVVGPVYLPAYDVVQERADGSAQITKMPGAHLVLKVEDHVPGAEMTLEEARPVMTTDILARKMMERLRLENRVEVYPEKLPNPAGYGDQFKGSFIRTQ